MVNAIIHRDMSWVKSQPQLIDMYSVTIIGWYWYQTVCNLRQINDFIMEKNIFGRNIFCRWSRSSFAKQFEIYGKNAVNINRRSESIQRLRVSTIKDIATKDFKNTQEYSLMLLIRKYIILIDQAAGFDDIDVTNAISLTWNGFLNDLRRSSCKHYIK